MPAYSYGKQSAHVARSRFLSQPTKSGLFISVSITAFSQVFSFVRNVRFSEQNKCLLHDVPSRRSTIRSGRFQSWFDGRPERSMTSRYRIRFASGSSFTLEREFLSKTVKRSFASFSMAPIVLGSLSRAYSSNFALSRLCRVVNLFPERTLKPFARSNHPVAALEEAVHVLRC